MSVEDDMNLIAEPLLEVAVTPVVPNAVRLTDEGMLMVGVVLLAPSNVRLIEDTEGIDVEVTVAVAVADVHTPGTAARFAVIVA